MSLKHADHPVGVNRDAAGRELLHAGETSIREARAVCPEALALKQYLDSIPWGYRTGNRLQGWFQSSTMEYCARGNREVKVSQTWGGGVFTGTPASTCGPQNARGEIFGTFQQKGDPG